MPRGWPSSSTLNRNHSTSLNERNQLVSSIFEWVYGAGMVVFGCWNCWSSWLIFWSIMERSITVSPPLSRQPFEQNLLSVQFFGICQFLLMYTCIGSVIHVWGQTVGSFVSIQGGSVLKTSSSTADLLNVFKMLRGRRAHCPGKSSLLRSVMKR